MIFIGIAIVIMGYSYFGFEVYEVEDVTNIVMTNLSIPAGIVAIILAGLVFAPDLKEITKSKERNGKHELVAVGSILLLATGFWLFLVLFGHSCVVLTNTFIGDHETYQVETTVISYRQSNKSNTKFLPKHYIEIKDPRNGQKVELRVRKKYKAGEIFQATLQDG
ncbi:MAG: hypothetical protein AAF193_11290, partial [Bacteroidota bacterium]